MKIIKTVRSLELQEMGGLWGRVREGSCLSISVPHQVMEKEEKNGRSARPRVAKV